MTAPPVPADHHRLWKALGHDPTPMDVLVERTGLTPAGLSSMLLAMELDGRIVVEHGRYARSSTGGSTVARQGDRVTSDDAGGPPSHGAPTGAGRGQ